MAKGKVDNDFRLLKRTITEAERKLDDLKYDKADERAVEKQAELVQQYKDKLERALKCVDLVTITKELRDGSLRERQCARVDVELFKRQGYKVEGEPVAKKPRAEKE
jgi:hypothetical protein